MGQISHFGASAAAQGISPKVFVTGISNGTCELTLLHKYKVSPDNFWYVRHPTGGWDGWTLGRFDGRSDLHWDGRVEIPPSVL